MSDSIGSLVTEIGNKSLNALWMRSSAISNNIANSDTPGYKAKSVNFEDQLSEALSGGSISENQVDGLEPTETESDATYGANGNGVDLESQLVELSRNQLQYDYLERGVSDNLGLLLTAAKGGK